MRQSETLVRPPAVAGRFYPASSVELESAVQRYLERGQSGAARRVFGLMAPHAGYVFSGGVAGQVFANAKIPRRVIVLGPNHTGLGARISVAPEGAYRLPGADVPIDAELARALLEEFPAAKADRDAHRAEHSIEVELPFLRARRPDVSIVPIVLAGLREEEALELGRALFRAIERIGGNALVVASSDMSHYLPDGEARAVDQKALEPLLAFEPRRLYRTVREQDISMCGFIPTTVMLSYCREAGANEPQLVGYATSGDAFGDRSRVVGYAGVLVS